MMTEDDNGVDSQQRVWNVPGLKAETSRLVSRTLKKIGKTSSRLKKVEAAATESESENDENVHTWVSIESDLEALRVRLKNLNLLAELLQAQSGSKNLGREAEDLVLELDVGDEPPVRLPRKKGKKKGPSTSQVGPRKPYKVYVTEDGTEIRVGKRASDNDELSCDPAHRHDDDWWMHSSGSAGSHVVLRCRSDEPHEEVVMDAAALAARRSKASGQTFVNVSMTRCRYVKKPQGAKDGLVHLTGKVRTITVHMKGVEGRLSRLDGSCDD